MLLSSKLIPKDIKLSTKTDMLTDLINIIDALPVYDYLCVFKFIRI
jgi:hypothetical protein